MDKYKLTRRETDLLEILWKADKALASSDFPQYDKTLATSTTLINLRKLLRKGLIIVSDHEIRNKALTRTYVPALTKQEYETKKYFNAIDKCEFNASSFLASFFEGNTDNESKLAELKKLEKVLKDWETDINKTEV